MSFFYDFQGVDLHTQLQQKVDSTEATVQEVRAELAEVRQDLRYTTSLLEAVY